ncbi:MAG: alpha/beta hydrolase-fold protein [Leptospiraceae bacterium]|nr:alpha/beta hydrolase-fold protein [Leptospiraceae bacterium]MDW7975759.1 alpha/beta hydrolase-fold protein [Leptospiraceae bacterium]
MKIESWDLPLRNYIFFSGWQTYTLIIMHGLGDQMESYRDFPELIAIPNVNYILLNAPEPYVIGWKWYDLEGNQEIGLKNSQNLLEKTIEILKTKLKIEKNKIILSGFSQGGVVSLFTGLRSREAYGGIISLSGYFYGDYKELSQESKQTPIFLAHGLYDPLIPFDWVKTQAEQLNHLGYTITWKEYPIEHTISYVEIQDLRDWLKTIMKF